MLATAGAVWRGVAHHDEAISGLHRLHLCDNDLGRCRLLGGTLGPTGYTFGVQQGLSLSGTGRVAVLWD
jgi:hypothetical protein